MTYPQQPQGPGRCGFVVGGLLLAAGVLGGTLLVVLGVVSTVNRVGNYQRVPAATGGTVDFGSRGTFNAYYERRGLRSGADIPSGLQLLLRGADGLTRRLAPNRATGADRETYHFADHEGARIARFRIERPGRYEVRVLGEPAAGGSADIAFGETAITGLAVGAVAGIFGGGFLALVGVVLLIATAVRRSNHRRRSTSLGPPYGGGSYGGRPPVAPWPGSGYGGPAPPGPPGWAPPPPGAHGAAPAAEPRWWPSASPPASPPPPPGWPAPAPPPPADDRWSAPVPSAPADDWWSAPVPSAPADDWWSAPVPSAPADDWWPAPRGPGSRRTTGHGDEAAPGFGGAGFPGPSHAADADPDRAAGADRP